MIATFQAVKTPHDDVVKLLTELVTELRIQNEDLRNALVQQCMANNKPSATELIREHMKAQTQ